MPFTTVVDSLERGSVVLLEDKIAWKRAVEVRLHQNSLKWRMAIVGECQYQVNVDLYRAGCCQTPEIPPS